MPTLLSRAMYALLILAFVSAGCDSGGDDDDPPPPPPPSALVQGSYAGTANVGGLAVSLTLTLAENSNTVTGSGILRGSDVISVSASGTRVNNDFNLTLSSEGFSDLNFAGNVSGGGAVMTGILNGSGFDSVQITLNRLDPAAPTETDTASSKTAPASGLMVDALR